MRERSGTNLPRFAQPVFVRCDKALAGSKVLTCTVIGFPLGATLTDAKVEETRLVINLGAQEVDMVIPIGLLKGGQYDAVERDIRSVVEVAHDLNALVKVIIETALLTRTEKIAGCLISKQAGADFVKTSTGFGPGGATVEDVELMRRVVGPEMGVKAAGIRTLADARAIAARRRYGLGELGVKLQKRQPQAGAA